MTVTEQELFRGYGTAGSPDRHTAVRAYPRRYLADLQPAVDRELRVAIEARIAELWAYRRWFASHLGWIPEQQVEANRELRLLVGFARRARRQAEDAAIAGVTWRAGDRDYHSWQARGPR